MRNLIRNRPLPFLRLLTKRAQQRTSQTTFKESERMEKLKSLDYRVVILVLLALSTPFVSPSVALPVTIISFSGLIAMKKWFEYQTKPTPSEDLVKEIAGIKNQMSSIMIKNASKPEEANRDFKRFF